jgi:hypothetical protein
MGLRLEPGLPSHPENLYGLQAHGFRQEARARQQAAGRTIMLYRILLGAIALAAVACSARAQDLSKYPDWSGQWRSMSGIQWDPTKPLGPAQQPPLTPEYQARYEASLADQAAGGLGDDPTGRCIPHGMPRVMTVVYPMEVVILPRTTYVLTDYTVSRRIFTDGRDWPVEMDQNFNGLSIGRWTDPDNDGRYTALVAETRGFKGPRTYEASGILLHADNQSVLKERFSLDKADKSILLDEITTIDNALTRPWTVIKKYRHVAEAAPLWHFNDCGEDNHHVRVGKDDYFISEDGYLMPVKKNQAPPDLRYFTPRR